MSTSSPAPVKAEPNDQTPILERLDERLRWLASWTIHHANHVRESRDGIKVGGHQASCASISSIMAALYFRALRPEDRVAVKPHASPVFHAIQYLFGRQTQAQLEQFRAFGGAQSYPSRTKDIDDVDFSTGSVGLGVAVTAFASLAQDYLISKGRLAPEKRGRMISLLGDAELDEGNIYEALIEAYKHDIRNTWWIVDYNRQSLDAITADRMFRRFDDVFATMGWEVVTLKYGKTQRAAFRKKGGAALRKWIDACPNADYAALTYLGGAEWRKRLLADLGDADGIETLLSSFDDDGLQALMTNLGGHCMESLCEAFEEVDDDRPRLFIAYTIKGYRLPFQGHKDNHSGLMTPNQMASYRADLGIPEGEEWAPFAGVDAGEAAALRDLVRNAPFAADTQRRHTAPPLAVPARGAFPVPTDASISTQAAFGKVMLELSKQDSALADALMTTSPDVTVSTNLGGFVNQRGLFNRTQAIDVFRKAKIPSPQKWQGDGTGQHVELGIAENNLFLVMAAFGLTDRLFGSRLLPVGTLYDPFIYRGLDALNYACYQDARFMLVATPSGITLGPEGGAHQSIGTPLVGMAQPGLTSFEPTYADEVSEIMRWAFEHMQAETGGSVYLRLSTRALEQPDREGEAWKDDLLCGAYWLEPPRPETELVLVTCGATAPEVRAAADVMAEDFQHIAVLNAVSPDRLHNEWQRGRADRWNGQGSALSHVERVLGQVPRSAGLVTVLDGAPATLSWLGGVCGHRVSPLGVTDFGQVGDLPDLYRHYRLDTDAIVEAAAELQLPPKAS
ncbi:MAG: transketolase [Pseudomonadota bacterium]